MNPDFNRLLTEPATDRRDGFLATARRLGTTVQNVEKDFWVCWTLDALFNGLQPDGPRLLFKGGTPLPKGHGLSQKGRAGASSPSWQRMGADPTIIRHVDDLAALKVGAATSSEFVGLARKAGADDLSRGGEAAAPWRILLNGFLAMDAALHQGSGGAR